MKDAHPPKFRDTYPTPLLQAGVELKTLQNLLGPQELRMHNALLGEGAEPRSARAKVDAVWNGKWEVWKNPAGMLLVELAYSEYD